MKNKKRIIAVASCALALLCATSAMAESVPTVIPGADATAAEEAIIIPTSMMGGQVLDTETSVYVAINEIPGYEDGKVMVYDKATGTVSDFALASNISQLVQLDGAIYALTPVTGGVSLIRITDKCEVLTTAIVIDQLSVYEGRLYFLADGKLNSILPDGTDLVQHSALNMGQYTIVGGTVYFSNMDDAKSYTINSKLQGQALSLDAGCMYSLNLASGVQAKLLGDGVKSIKANNGDIYMQYMGESYATTVGGTEQPSGRLCKFDPATRTYTRLDVQDEYSYFPTTGGLAVHTDYDLSLYSNGVYSMSLYSPEINSSVYSVNDYTMLVYEPVSARLTLVSTDINVANVTIMGQPADPNATARPTLSPDSTASADNVTPIPTVKPTSAPAATVKPTSSALSGIVFQDSATRRLTEKEVRALDDSQLIYARYEILARNGYVFQDSKYLKYYRQFSWYNEDSSFKFGDLGTIESYNYELIRSVMNEVFATPTPKPTVKPTATPVPQDGYIFNTSSTKKLTRKQVLAIDIDDLLEARYEILARNGYVFDTASWQKYFESKDWYQADKSFAFGDMNSIESYNYELIKSIDKEINATPEPTVTPDPSLFIFPNATTKKLTRDEILAVDSTLLLQARYEILARNGYVFDTASWQKYFETQSWYKANSSFKFGSMNDVESYNYALIKSIDKEINGTPEPDPTVKPTENPGPNPTVKPSEPTARPTDPADTVIFPDSNTRELTIDDLKTLSFNGLIPLARDEILARHGYVFDESTKEGANSAFYFGQLNWYVKNPAFDPFVEGALNEFELYNYNFIQSALNGDYGAVYMYSFED